jgi:hypothetical protein
MHNKTRASYLDILNICGLQAGLLFIITVFWGLIPVFTAIFTFPQERAMLNKERAADMYRLSTYFLARTTSDLPLDLILSVLFLLIVYFMAGLRLSAASFFLTVVTVFLCIIAAQVCISKTTNKQNLTAIMVMVAVLR